ncbi:TerD family protein [Embleya sp. NBC_00888]|uniref:TerD family protein n=1 Tax=Embleya sp. NBC_00888 TaxID=2975960 RepID=UPI00386E49D1|nr:TerD family protein [Embleya sp. NBC_00888]
MRTFAMGEKTRLDDSAIRVEFDVSGEGLAAYCFSLGTADLDVVCTARPASLISAVALVAGGTGTAEFHVDLSAVDDAVDRLVFAVGAQAPGFGAGSLLRLLGADGEIGRFVLPVAELTRERALILAEIYRRDGWRFGAVGQGYEAGVDQLVRDLGADPEQTLIVAAVMAHEDVVEAVEPATDAAVHPPVGDPGPEGAAPGEATPEDREPEDAKPADAPPEDVRPEDVRPGDAAAAGAEPEPVASIASEPVAEAVVEAVDEPAAPSSAEHEPAPAPEPLPAPATGETPPAGVYEGRGDKVLSITRPVEAGPFLVELEGRGTDNFVVWTLDADLETDKLLANAIGAYRGRALVDERSSRTSRLKIEADGAWTVRLFGPDAARPLTERLTGTGPETVRWAGPRTVLAMTHRGTGNFIVGTFADHGGDESYLGTLANAIGDYEGESILPKGPCLIELEADGDWTLTPVLD